MADRLQEALDRLVEEGTLSPAQAKRVDQALRTAGLTSHPWEGQAADWSRRSRTGEVLSYAGGALVVGALTLLVGLSWDELSRLWQVVICAVATLLLLGAAYVFGRRTRATRGPTVASALGGLGAAGAAVTVAVAIPSNRVLLTGIALVVVAFLAYLVWKGAPLLFAMYAGGGLIVLDLLDRLPDGWPASRTYALTFIGYGVLWILLEYVTSDGWISGVLGSFTAFVGAEVGAFDSSYPLIGLAFGIIVITALFWLFWVRRSWAYAFFGVLTALVVPSTALGRIWENAVVGAVVLLVVGGCLVGAAALAGRVRASDRGNGA